MKARSVQGAEAGKVYGGRRRRKERGAKGEAGMSVVGGPRVKYICGGGVQVVTTCLFAINIASMCSISVSATF